MRRLRAAVMAPWPVRIHLVTADSPESRRLRYSRLIQFPQLTMPLLHTDEVVEPVRFDRPADLVGITAPTPSALHAYCLPGEARPPRHQPGGPPPSPV
ncbi:MAG: hypothetical protein HYR86_09830 [Candidatus Rokubacteria bacterium]|nr:hypothetical protein [Candidatus Rokubacteria bacterium]